MSNKYLAEALDKLGKDAVGKISGQKKTVMAKPVAEALKSFCRQSDDFARAVAQGGTFDKCMEAVAKNVGSAISDLDAYKRAVEFYLPGASIRMTMTIDLAGDCTAPDEKAAPTLRVVKPERASLVLNLEDFL